VASSAILSSQLSYNDPPLSKTLEKNNTLACGIDTTKVSLVYISCAIIISINDKEITLAKSISRFCFDACYVKTKAETTTKFYDEVAQ
jgi:hypothetical protein